MRVSTRCSTTCSRIGGSSKTCRKRSLDMGCVGEVQPAALADIGFVEEHFIVGFGRLQAHPRTTCPAPGPRSEGRRKECGGGLVNASVLGGLEEFCEFFPQAHLEGGNLGIQGVDLGFQMDDQRIAFHQPGQQGLDRGDNGCLGHGNQPTLARRCLPANTFRVHPQGRETAATRRTDPINS